MEETLTEEQWSQYTSRGYVRLGKTLAATELSVLQKRMDDIMMGRAPLEYDRMLMQLDRDAPGPESQGHKGATLSYRKIQGLEFDPDFLAYIRKPLFRHICGRAYGAKTDIACFRAMFLNKPANEGTKIDWHQDRWNYLDRDPLITVWTAIDPATVENGCVKIIPRAHHLLINPSSRAGHLTKEQTEKLLVGAEVAYLELDEGESVLLHNHLPHASEINATDSPRRAFSACYMDAATKTTNNQSFSVLFGNGAIELDGLS